MNFLKFITFEGFFQQILNRSSAHNLGPRHFFVTMPLQLFCEKNKTATLMQKFTEKPPRFLNERNCKIGTF
jgi:hypothetical protein